MSRKLATLLLGLTVCCLLTGCQSERAVKAPEPVFPQAKTAPQDPGVDLERGLLTASGIGLPTKSGAGDAQAKLLARRAAIVDGQRNLANRLTALERRVGMQPTDPATIKNYTIVEEKQVSDGGYRVVLQLKLEEALLKRLRQH